MTTIRVIDLVGPLCIAWEEGAKLREVAQTALQGGETVVLDFSGVTTVTPSFLNTAVGPLYALFSSEDIERRLVCTGLDEVDEAILRLVRQRASLFYSANPSQQDALLAASSRPAEE